MHQHAPGAWPVGQFAIQMRIRHLPRLSDRLVEDRQIAFAEFGRAQLRAGVIVDGQQRGVETGYFVIVADSDDPLAAPDLTVETHMTIRGQAVDHQALSRFVRSLFEEPAINDVNVQRTSLTNYANGRVVEFDITVVLNSRYRES